MKLLDYLIGAAALILIFISFQLVSFSSTGKSEVYIEGDKGTWIYPLDSELEMTVPGPVGETEIHLEGGEVFISHSDCPEQICVQSGSVSRGGQWIACMPNRVFISIKNSDEEAVDGEAY